MQTKAPSKISRFLIYDARTLQECSRECVSNPPKVVYFGGPGVSSATILESQSNIVPPLMKQKVKVQHSHLKAQEVATKCAQKVTNKIEDNN